MIPSLAERFRTQRTDRIRVDGEEVLSVAEFSVHRPSAVEIVIEQSRTDLPEGLALHAPVGAISILAAELAGSDADASIAGDPVDDLVITLPAGAVVELEIDPSVERDTVQLWNVWVVDGTEHAWTGNAGLMIETLEPPVGADLRWRLWCSDGLGEPSFDDLVAVITVGPAGGEPASADPDEM